ncbi:DUF5681 domain-containing protein [Allosphingosinicella deserti]|uniref:DUF5681 domain-containing protein n=1 Tax=Allosphingosinicella deserti TaxID=2116704 RepID=A0A2P7QF87_9SPHN|nr:DUF5681 domain-containing protein [Sphingomonas deserti]PSJ36623.1 hypothetical protein C7I55_24830 [Sphingomonas deserti]
MPDPTTIARAESGQFLPGTSGNPAGRPRGSRNRASVLRDLVDGGEAASIARMVVERAIDGEWAAMRILFTRLFPPAREAAIEFDLPEVTTRADAVAASAALIAATASGEITPGEARKLLPLLTTHMKMIDALEREQSRNAAADADDEALPAPAAAREPETLPFLASPASVAAMDDRAPCKSPVVAADPAHRMPLTQPADLNRATSSDPAPARPRRGDAEGADLERRIAEGPARHDAPYPQSAACKKPVSSRRAPVAAERGRPPETLAPDRADEEDALEMLEQLAGSWMSQFGSGHPIGTELTGAPDQAVRPTRIGREPDPSAFRA